jgi:LysW-gamma-L-lysine carboxypeptidase
MDELGILEGLLKRYSPPGQEQEAVEFLTREMDQRGFDETRMDGIGNAIGTKGQGKNELLLLGHIDTVPGYIEVKRDGDILHGRGAVDAKGPLACFTVAASSAKIGPDWRVSVIGAVCEEGDSRGAKYLVDKYSPDMVVIGEPSGWNRITLGYKGSAWIKYSVSKTIAHTAAKAKSASETAVSFWNSIVNLCDSYNSNKEKNFNQLTPSLRNMGADQDGFVDNAFLFMNFRLPPEVNTNDLMEKLESLKDEGSLVMEDGVSSYRSDKNTSLVRAFLSSIRKNGGTPIFTTKTGTSDMNVVAPVWNTPILAYGPGDSDLDHTPQEHIVVSEYSKSIQILKNVIELITLTDQPGF